MDEYDRLKQIETEYEELYDKICNGCFSKTELNRLLELHLIIYAEFTDI